MTADRIKLRQVAMFREAARAASLRMATGGGLD